MDLLRRRRILAESPALAFAAGALAIELAVVAVPWNFGHSYLSDAIAHAFSFVQKASNLIAVLTYAVTIFLGIVLHWRASRAIAAGLFLGVAIVIGLREVSTVLGLLSGGRWFWQTVVVNTLIVGECVLLLLAARAASSSSPK